METEILDKEITPHTERRRKLLPIWVKIFLWIFMIFGAFAPLGLVFGLLGMNFNVELYGFETTNPFSPIGLLLVLLFAIKGMVAYGLWFEKDWAVVFALFDGILGISVCVFVMFGLPYLMGNNLSSFNIRLELLALIPYVVTMKKIKEEWASRNALK